MGEAEYGTVSIGLGLVSENATGAGVILVVECSFFCVEDVEEAVAWVVLISLTEGVTYGFSDSIAVGIIGEGDCFS